MQLGELLAKEQRARHMGLSQVGVVGFCLAWRRGNALSIFIYFKPSLCRCCFPSPHVKARLRSICSQRYFDF